MCHLREAGKRRDTHHAFGETPLREPLTAGPPVPSSTRTFATWSRG
jgi:hypothetical protein